MPHSAMAPWRCAIADAIEQSLEPSGLKAQLRIGGDSRRRGKPQTYQKVKIPGDN
jgi:hypothetical protein